MTYICLWYPYLIPIYDNEHPGRTKTSKNKLLDILTILIYIYIYIFIVYIDHPSCISIINMDHFRVNLGSLWDYFGIILESFWDCFGIILGSFWDHSLTLRVVAVDPNWFWPCWKEHVLKETCFSAPWKRRRSRLRRSALFGRSGRGGRAVGRAVGQRFALLWDTFGAPWALSRRLFGASLRDGSKWCE